MHEWQWWIEDIAQTPVNEPARDLYSRQAQPIVDHVGEGITSIFDEETRASEDGNMASALFGDLAEFRFTLLQIQTVMNRFLDFGDPAHAAAAGSDLRVAAAHMQRIVAALDDLSPRQREIISWIEPEFVAYGSTVAEVIELRQRDDWHLAEHLLASRASPLAAKATAILTDLSGEQQRLMESSAADFLRIGDAVLVALVALILLMALSA